MQTGRSLAESPSTLEVIREKIEHKLPKSLATGLSHAAEVSSSSSFTESSDSSSAEPKNEENRVQELTVDSNIDSVPEVKEVKEEEQNLIYLTQIN